ncbi:geranylgeranyl reductase family protein [Chloroflexota bacterium]
MQDVVIAGGGPIGSHIALRLAEAGYDVLVLEKREAIGGRVCCAGILGQECITSYNIDSSLIMRQANSAKIFSPSGRLIHLWRQQNQASIVDRAAFDLFMADRAITAGAEYIFNCNAKDIEVKKDSIIVRATEDGIKQEYEARALVIANGFGSKLVENVGLGKSGDFVIGAQAEVETTAAEEVEVYMGRGIAPGFFAWLLPTTPKKALAGLLSRKNPKGYLNKLLSTLKTDIKITDDNVEIDCRGISIKPLHKTYSRRLIVAGDAAGQVKPTTGGGIYFGLLAADAAVASLKQALQSDNLSAGSLADYQRQWQKQLSRELKIDYWARKIFERLSDKQIDRIFDITIDKGIDKGLLEADDLSFDWHSRAIGRVLRQKALTGALAAMKIPFKIGLG